MCLYPRKLKNRKYTATVKNGGNIPEPPIIGYDHIGPIYDQRVLEIEVPCGQCIECREAKAREWQVRLAEEIKTHKYNYFITLTFAPKELENLCNKYRLKECNAVAANAVRHAIERYRKDHKKSLKHWLITELGHEGTERIHMHGLLFSDHEIEFGEAREDQLRTWKYWKYGHVYVGQYVNQQTINYISKYITKIDTDHKGFIGQILASPGIGKAFLDRQYSNTYTYRPGSSADFYRLQNGSKVKLPTYYKNKLYNEEEREQMWRDFMDKEKITILGNDHSTRTCKTIDTIKENAQAYNSTMGYGDNSGEWKKKDYNITKKMLKQDERNRRIAEMKSKLLDHYANIPGKITLQETFEMKKNGLNAKEIETIVALRGRDF